MGYYTYFQLTAPKHLITPELYDKILNRIAKFDEFGVYPPDVMYQLSLDFPNFLFTLHGNGEDEGDIWGEYWQNGRYERCNMTMPPYDPNKMTLYHKEKTNGT